MKPEKNRLEQYKEKKDSSMFYLKIAVLALFIGTGSSVGFYAYTLIDFYSLSKYIIGFAVVGFLIPLKYYRQWFNFIKYEMIIFNLIGLAPFLTGLLLCLNFIMSSDPSTQKYKIEQIYSEGEKHSPVFGLILEDNAFSGEGKVIVINQNDLKELSGKSFLKLTIAKGLFNFDVIKEKKFTD